MLCLRDEGEKARQDYEGILVHRIPLRKKRGSKLRYLFEFAAGACLFFLKLSALFIRRRYDVVQVNNIPNFYVFAALVPKVCRRRVLLDMHEMMPELFLHRYHVKSGNLLHRLLLLEEKLSARFASEVITVTDRLADVVRKRNGLSSVRVVMNTANPSPSAVEAGERHREGEKLRLIFHGILTNTYRMTAVVDALSQLLPSQNFEFHVYGDGTTRAALVDYVGRKGLGDRIFFRGFLPWQELQGRILEYDLAVVPLDNNIYSRFAFASKVSQYAAMRIPILCSDVECMRAYFDDDAILYFDLDDPGDLAEKIRGFVKRRADVEARLVEAAYAQNLKITWDVMKERYLSLFEPAHV